MPGANDEVLRCKEAALKWLTARARSVEEVRAHLVKKGFAAAAIDTAVADLGRAGLLSDEALAREVAEGTVREAPAGRALIEHRVRRRQVDEDAAERAVEETTKARSESADALALARGSAARLLRATKGDAGAAARRLLALLARRGFEEQDALEAATRALREAGADPEV